MPVAITRLLSVAFFAGCVLSLSVYPLEGSWLSAILLGYTALLCWRPVLWLFALPALLPAVDLAPHTGWFFLEEIDLLLMISAGFCYWHLQQTLSLRPHWTPSFRVGLLLLAVACTIGLWRGLQPLTPIDANAFNSYLSSYNAVRVGKAWLWAFVLLPPLRQAAGPQLEGLRRYLVPGILAGLLLTAGAAIRERIQFPGLLNFSSDYRITAPFSAMHTGGAALDGYLALSFPVIAMWLLGRQSAPRTIAALALLSLVLYAGLATFSRALYLGYAVAIVLLVFLPLLAMLDRRGIGLTIARKWRAGVVVAACALVTLAVLNAVFITSGYRGYGAAVILLAAVVIFSAQTLNPSTLVRGLCCGLALAWLLAWTLPVGTPPHALLKPPYLLFICSALVFSVALRPAMLVLRFGWQPVAVLAYAGLLLNAGWIALYHAGSATLAPSAALAMLALFPPGVNLVRGRPLWKPSRRNLTAALAALLVLASMVPIYHGYYVNERFSTSGNDFSARLRHWAQVLSMMDDGVDAAIVGMGLGKFPVTYYWRNLQHETPPSYRYLDFGNNRYLRLSAGDYAAGYGELLRMLQKVKIEPGTQYQLGIDVWNSGPPGFLHINLCQRQLLYRQNCMVVPLRQIPYGPYWTHYQFTLTPGVLGNTNAPVQLEVAAEGRAVALDIDNISLRSMADDHELLRNGSFSEANNYWFFSSDRHHLPWHVKNLGLNLYFEMGWPGLLALGILLASAAASLVRRAWTERDGCEAVAWLGALAGFLVVGLFDSLIDVPRITLLFMLILCAAALQPAALAKGSTL